MSHWPEMTDGGDNDATVERVMKLDAANRAVSGDARTDAPASSEAPCIVCGKPESAAVHADVEYVPTRHRPTDPHAWRPVESAEKPASSEASVHGEAPLWAGKVSVLGDTTGRKWSAEVTATQALAVFEGSHRRPLAGPNDAEHLRALAIELARRLAAAEADKRAQVERAHKEGFSSGWSASKVGDMYDMYDQSQKDAWLRSRSRAELERAAK